jgi:hypothetical protein
MKEGRIMNRFSRPVRQVVEELRTGRFIRDEPRDD